MKWRIFLIFLIGCVLTMTRTVAYSEEWEDVISPETMHKDTDMGPASSYGPVTESPSMTLSESGSSTEDAKKLRVVFVSGYYSNCAFFKKNSEYETMIRTAFSAHHVTFYPAGINSKDALNGKETLEAIQGADIFYFNTHSAPPYQGQQTLKVAPSPDNTQISPGGSTFITAGQVREVLKGKNGPKLVIINGCEVTKTDDGVPKQGRFSQAFGMDNNTPGKAFLGWNYVIWGRKGDSVFRKFLTKWAKIDEQGESPTIADLLKDPDIWTPLKAPTLIGDGDLRITEKDVDNETILGSWGVIGHSTHGWRTKATMTFTENGRIQGVFESTTKDGKTRRSSGNGKWELKDSRLVIRYDAGAVYDSRVEGNARKFQTVSNNGWTLIFTRQQG